MRGALLLAATAALALMPWPALAACRLALLLAMDISSSVDAEEDAMQRQGLAAALSASDVVEAFFLVPGRSVAVAITEWSGRVQQDVMVDWTVIDSRTALAGVAARVAASRRPYADFSTAVGAMLLHSDAMMARAPRCDAQVLDVSGDGVHNDGVTPAEAYAAGALSRTIVNGLAIVTQDRTLDHAADDDLMGHYRAEVIRGPGAFVLRADGFEDFQEAMTRKLLRELTIQVGALR